MLLTLTWIAHDVFEEVVLGPTVPKINNKIILSVFCLEIQIYIILTKNKFQMAVHMFHQQ